ncbi:MAG: hypothetical protein IJW40_03445 [Clostridia bacterium]|nr:hypothetical protein [Clostridia bacterium]
MFYDERIEAVRGRVCRNAIALALPIAALSLLIRIVTLLTNGALKTHWYLATVDIVVLLGTALILLCGAMRGTGRIKDEMWQAQQGSFYSTASIYLICGVLGIWALFLPRVLIIGTPDFYTIPFDALLPAYLFIIGTYVITAFRQQDIYFNYSILEGEHYAGAVGRNCGKGALLTLACMLLSVLELIARALLTSLPHTTVLRTLLQLLFLYLGVFLTFGLLYILLSYLEWASFTRKKVVSPATVLSLLLAVALYAAYTVIVALADHVAVTQSIAITMVNYAAELHEPVRLMLLLFLTYFAYEYSKLDEDRRILPICRVMVTISAVRVFCDLMYSSIIGILWNALTQKGSYFISQLLSGISVTLDSAENAVYSIGFALILIIWIKAGRIKRGHVVAIPVLAALWGVGIFLSTQTDVVHLALYHACATVAFLIYVSVALLCVRWENMDIEEE